MDSTKIIVQGKTLSVLLVKDGHKYGAFCPELDMVTEMDTLENAFEDLIEAIKDYADEYINELDLYSTSPNRAHHLPYIEAVKACKTDWDIRMLIEIKHGSIHV
jgi:predicted RNase H-like HicB family nuclease